MVKRKAEEPINRPVSAFAARRVAKNPLADATNQNSANDAAHGLVPDEENNRVPNPPKKRKIRGIIDPLSSPANLRSSGYWAAQNTSNTVGPQKNVQQFDISVVSDTCSINGDEIDDRFSSSESEIYLPGEPPIRKLSTFTPTKDNVIGDAAEEWTIRLNFGDNVTLLGQYDIWVREGAVSILGAKLHASSRINRVYAPSSHSLPSIRPIRDPCGPEHQSVVITISGCATRIRMLRELSPKFGRIWNHKHVRSEEPKTDIDLSRRSFLFLKSSADDRHRRPLNLLDIPSDWRTLINQLTPSGLEAPRAVMICGPKGTGKSTFCRILANYILTSPAAQLRSGSSNGKDGIAFLDLDPGQPEYSPPGDISLVHLRSCNLGVPYTHPLIISSEGNNLIRAHHVGGVTLKDDPGHYQRCALNLLYHHKRMLLRYPSCPLIVNCSGWVQGSGLEVLIELIRQWDFTDIIHISKPGPVEVVETLADSAKKAGVPFYTLMAQPSEVTTRTAADLRLMQTLSYFHLDEPEGGDIRWNPTIINEMAPVTARYAGAGQDIFAIIILGEEQDPEFLAGILEGSVVGLVAVEDDTAINDKDYSQNSRMNTGSELEMVEEPEAEAESIEQAQWTSHQTHRDKPLSDSESDQASDSSCSSSFQPYAPRRERGTPESKNRKESQTNHDMGHPLVSRTPEGLPYLSSGNGTNTPLDPFKSHSIGQALVRGINTTTKTLHLLTPIAPPIFQSLRQRNTKIVLVRGRLDIPTWAYREEYFAAIARRRRGKRESGDAARFRANEMKAWAEGTPWARFIDGKEPRGPGGKVWRVRRNLKTRGLGGTVSE